MRIVKSGVPPLRPVVGRLFESDVDRSNQSQAMMTLLGRWHEVHGLDYDAIDLGTASDIDYLIVSAESYSGGPLPARAAGAVEYKRRKGAFTYDSLFVERHKRDALLEMWQTVGGRPIFFAEWDDVYQLVDVRGECGSAGMMARLDRGLPEDTDGGFYIPKDRLYTIPKRPS